MENFVIRSLASLEAEGFSVAFVAGNRSINEKNIKSKKGSFDEFKCNLVPLLYVSGEKAVKDGCTIVDSSTGKDIEKAKADSYIVVLDGQHRFTAAMECELSHDRIYLFEDYSGADTKKLLATSNVDSFPWNASDFIGGAVLFNPENEMAKFAKELTDLDYPSSTISHILCFKGGKITKRQYAKIMQGESVSIDECDIDASKSCGNVFVCENMPKTLSNTSFWLFPYDGEKAFVAINTYFVEEIVEEPVETVEETVQEPTEE